MKQTKIKRLVYSNGDGQVRIGNIEYDNALSNDNILCAIHEVGKTQWIGRSLWLMQAGVPTYRISVETFTRFEKTWFENLKDAIRRI